MRADPVWTWRTSLIMGAVFGFIGRVVEKSFSIDEFHVAPNVD